MWGQLLVVLASFSMDTTIMMDSASDIFNALWPVFGLIVGIVLGFGILALIVKEIRAAV